MPGPGEHSKNEGLPLIIGLLAINVFWGASFVANAIALQYIGPIEIASIRFFIAAPLLLIVTYLWKGKETFKFDKRDIPTFIILALTGVTFQYAIQVSAQEYTSATSASLLINTSVFFIMILGAVFLREKMTWYRIMGAVIGFIGVALLVTKGSLSLTMNDNSIGDLMIIACAFLWSVYTIYGKRIATKYHPIVILNYIFIIGAVGMLPFYFLTPHMPIQDVPLTAIAAILFLVVFCSIIAYLIYNIALEKMDTSKVAVYIYFVPLSTIILAALILHETLTMASAAGGIMVLVGMYLAEKH
ncbi:MAG TPA: DMT family transporter [Methanocellaceae archaeon]